jgi:glycosyltransferase involved in cell wall biosynthesis
MQWPEPFGLVMIEALAAGTPVVATPAGSAPEIVDDGITGYLQENRLALAEALVAAADLDRSACRAAAVARFDTDRMIREHVQLYTDLIGSDRGPAAPRAVDHPASPRKGIRQRAGLAAQLDA